MQETTVRPHTIEPKYNERFRFWVRRNAVASEHVLHLRVDSGKEFLGELDLQLPKEMCHGACVSLTVGVPSAAWTAKIACLLPADRGSSRGYELQNYMTLCVYMYMWCRD